jgi:hypothetical protein
MVHFQSKNLAFAALICAGKRHDSINGIIAEARRYSQHLDTCSALRDAGCGFFAASLAGSG